MCEKKLTASEAGAKKMCFHLVAQALLGPKDKSDLDWWRGLCGDIIEEAIDASAPPSPDVEQRARLAAEKAYLCRLTPYHHMPELTAIIAKAFAGQDAKLADKKARLNKLLDGNSRLVKEKGDLKAKLAVVEKALKKDEASWKVAFRLDALKAERDANWQAARTPDGVLWSVLAESHERASKRLRERLKRQGILTQIAADGGWKALHRAEAKQALKPPKKSGE